MLETRPVLADGWAVLEEAGVRLIAGVELVRASGGGNVLTAASVRP